MGNPFIPPTRPNNKGSRNPRHSVPGGKRYWEKRVNNLRRNSAGPPIGTRGFDTKSAGAGAAVEERMDALMEVRPVRRVES